MKGTYVIVCCVKHYIVNNINHVWFTVKITILRNGCFAISKMARFAIFITEGVIVCWSIKQAFVNQFH